MPLRKLSVKMLVDDEHIKEIVGYLLDAPHEWVEINVGSKTGSKKR